MKVYHRFHQKNSYAYALLNVELELDRIVTQLVEYNQEYDFHD